MPHERCMNSCMTCGRVNSPGANHRKNPFLLPTHCLTSGPVGAGFPPLFRLRHDDPIDIGHLSRLARLVDCSLSLPPRSRTETGGREKPSPVGWCDLFDRALPNPTRRPGSEDAGTCLGSFPSTQPLLFSGQSIPSRCQTGIPFSLHKQQKEAPL